MNQVTPSTAQTFGGAGAGIATMCLGAMLLGTSDMLAKQLSENHNPLQIVFVRNLMAAPLIAMIVMARDGASGFTTQHVKLHAVRGLLGLGAAYSFFTGLKTLGLAEATSIAFVAPIFITVVCAVVLREAVGWRRWLAVLVGFGGVLVIVRPGAEAFQPASLYAIAAAGFYSMFMLSTRWIGQAESLWTMMFFNNLFPLVYAAPLVGFVWSPLPAESLWLLAGMAVVATLGVTLIGQAFRMAPASVVAPFDYTLLIWASLWGWLIWGELPDGWTWAGSAVIIASGIYIVLREARVGAHSHGSIRGGDVVEQGVDARDG